MTASEIRQTFLDFFHSRGHIVVPSAPIVLKNDPTLLFTNAGMNQFKDYFLGNKKPSYPRVADTQKCLRVSGKQNDLEEVGVDTYHHTMFEMLGNWSFGDYFKKEAIAWSWELLTEVFKLDKDRLYVTIFQGDAEEKVPRDEEAFNEWKKWMGEDRILLGSKKDNFWEMGDTGPCGPCTEIHVDCRTEEQRRQIDGKSLVNNDHPQVIEIWNNVFIQFNRLKDGRLEALPAKHVDTGMGFERLVRVIQGKASNYDTDLFSGTIRVIEKITGKKYSGGDKFSDIAFRVIADHIRAIAFTISDGQLPSNTGAGYVIRRILRRAVRYYYSYLGYKQPLLFELLPTLAKQFELVFPELQQQIEFVTKIVKEEEVSFLRTIASGILSFQSYMNEGSFTVHGNNEAAPIKKSENEIVQKTVEGEFAFELYDTYGFPIDLTQLMAKEQGWEVDMEGYEKALQQQKKRSRAAGALDTEDWQVLRENGQTKFVGYDSLETPAMVVKFRKVRSKGKESFQLVLDTTPFYAESGGQVGDTGELIINNEKLRITDTKRENDLIIHFAESLPSSLSGLLIAKVDVAKRKAVAVHHSATHLLHAALRVVLGSHVTQKGSLVDDEHLRFDFSHFAKMTDAEISKIETLVNEKIRQNIPVIIKEMPKEEALKLGAMALFGEKYGDWVRVVIIDTSYSVELCGGTHVVATGELGYFKIKHETAVAAGVRRVEAIAGATAERYINEELETIRELKERLKSPKELLKAVDQVMTENAELKKTLQHLEDRILVGVRNDLLHKDEIINGITFVGDIVTVSHPDTLKKLCFDLKNHLHDCVTVLAANIGGKPYVAIAIADSVVSAKGLDAAKIIKEHVAPLIKGGGGGQKNLATAGGQDPGNLKQVIEKVKSFL